MNIIKSCNKIVEICNNEEKAYTAYKSELGNLIDDIKRSSAIFGEPEVDTIITSHKALTAIKNRKAAYSEAEFARMILVKLPLRLIFQEEGTEAPIETLEEENLENVKANLRIPSKLLVYAKELLNAKADKSKRYHNRIKESLRLLNELLIYYNIREVKSYFMRFIESKDNDVQFFALNGLKTFCSLKETPKLSKDEIGQIVKIAEKNSPHDFSVQLAEDILHRC